MPLVNTTAKRARFHTEEVSVLPPPSEITAHDRHGRSGDLDRVELSNRLAIHFKASNPARATRRGDWRIFASAACSVLAGTTGASAGQIIYNGGSPVTASIASVGPSGSASALKLVHLSNAAHTAVVGVFGVGVGQQSFASLVGSAFIPGGGAAAFLRDPVIGGGPTATPIRMLASGSMISAGAGNFHPPCPCGSQLVAEQKPGIHSSVGWQAAKTGFAGFFFQSTGTAGAGHVDYGWVRLVFTVGVNGAANSITAIDWAYDAAGDPIQAGEGTTAATPEPSTGALALLASGSAGVLALWRRRKLQSASHPAT